MLPESKDGKREENGAPGHKDQRTVGGGEGTSLPATGMLDGSHAGLEQFMKSERSALKANVDLNTQRHSRL